MYVYIYVCIYIYVHVYVYVYIYTRTYNLQVIADREDKREQLIDTLEVQLFKRQFFLTDAASRHQGWRDTHGSILEQI